MQSNIKTRLAVATMLAALIGVLYVVTSTIILDGFSQVEVENTRQNVERVTKKLADELAQLSTITGDYAAWDDTYAFVRDVDPGYIRANLVDETFVNLDVNLMLFVDPFGRIVFGKHFDLVHGEQTPIPASILKLLAPDGLLLPRWDNTQTHSGIAVLPEGFLLISASPILLSDHTGAVRGTLFMGRYLDAAHMDRLTQVTNLSFKLYRPDDPQLPPDFQSVRDLIPEDGPVVVRALSDDSVAGYAVVKDILDDPGLMLRVDLPRTIYRQGQVSTQILLLALLAIGAVLGGVTLLLLEWLSLSQQKRRESEERYRQLVEFLPDAIFVHTAGEIVFSNPAGVTLAGAEHLPQVVGKQIFDFVPSEDRAAIREQIEKVEQSGNSVNLAEQPLNQLTGQTIYAEIVAIPIVFESRAASLSIVRDITERRRANEQIRRLNDDLERRVLERTAQLEAVNRALEQEVAERKRAEEHLVLLERAVAAAPNGIVITDPSQPDNPIIFANPACEQITGYSQAETLGRNPRFLQGPDPYQAGLVELRAALREGRECHVLLRNFRKNGSLYWNELRVSPVRDPTGKLTHFVGVQDDITELKLIEEAVRASEERFRQLADNVREVFWVASSDWSELLYVSPAYEDMWGRTCESLYREPTSFLTAIHPDDRERIVNVVQQRRIESPVFAEYRILRVDGTIGWIWSRIFPVRDPAGSVYRIVGLTEDVTERKQAEEDLRRALDKERELNELKSRFISMTSHEFRTPLTAIMSSAELLEFYSHKLTDQKKLDHLHRIQTATKSMTQMLNDVLTIGKTDAGKLEFKPAPLDLARFCRDLVDEMQFGAGARHTIEYVTRGDGARASVDEKLLRQILTNLLSNAIKYSPQGGTVRLALQREDGQAIFTVQDQGIGIPPEEQGQLFDTFHRAKNVGTIPGTGLGLAIVKRSVEAHGGRIDFSSQVGVGTTFTISIPLNESMEAEQACPSATLSPSPLRLPDG